MHLRLIDPPVRKDPRFNKDLQVGDCWPARGGWAIVLPGPALWYSVDPAEDGRFWTVTGEAPALMVDPSIDMSPGWHGRITNGEFT